MVASKTAWRVVRARLVAASLVAAATATAMATAMAQTAEVAPPPADNPAIDMPGFLRDAHAAAELRRHRRVDEAAFIRMSREPGTIVLDARSRQKFDELHVKGAVHLAFPDIAIASLDRLVPDRATRILIYCNNNFRGAEGPFPGKLPVASLNLSTWVALYSYGYRDVYELAPLLDLDASALELESNLAAL